MLVEEYRARFERPEQLEVPAFNRNAPLRGRVRPPGPPSRAWVVAALAVGLLAVLFVLGITSDEDGKDGGSTTADRTDRQGAGAGQTTREARDDTGRQERTRPAADSVRVSVVPARDAWICLVDAKGRLRVEGRVVAAGDREGPFRSRRFRITVGNGGGDFRVNGRLRDVPDRSFPLGYSISPSRVRLLPESERPTCEPGGPGAAEASQ